MHIDAALRAAAKIEIWDFWYFLLQRGFYFGHPPSWLVCSTCAADQNYECVRPNASTALHMGALLNLVRVVAKCAVSSKKIFPQNFQRISIPLAPFSRRNREVRDLSSTQHPEFWKTIYSSWRNPTFSGGRRNSLITKWCIRNYWRNLT